MKLQRIQPVAPSQRRSGDSIPGAPPSATSPAGTGNPEPPLFRLNILRAIQLHRRLAMGITLAGAALAAAYVMKAWPTYIAQSQIYIQPVQFKVMSGADQSFTSNSAAYDSFVQQQVQSASNPEVLLSALHKLKAGSWQRTGETEQAAAARLGGAIEVAREGTSYEVAIVAKAKDPQLAAQIANAMAASIVDRASGEGNAGNEQRISVLRDERDRIHNQLISDYAEQNDLNKQLGMAAVGTEAPDLIDADIGKTREELIKAQTDHDQAAARFTAMGAGKADSSAAIDAEADDLVAADAGLTSMKTSLNSRRATLITQMSNLTPNNPEYKQDAAELAKINGSLEAMMKDLRSKAAARIQEKLKMDLERTAGVEERLNGQLRQLAGTAASATPKLQRASDLATDIARLRTRYTTVDEQLHNLMLENSAPGAVHLSLAAVAPLHPAISGILKKALPLALGGLLLGLLAASIANHLDPRVYIGADIEQVLGFAPMAVLPDFDEVPDEVSTEHLLRLTSAIEHARHQGDLNNCIFTGTSSGTGVTTLAIRVRDILEAMGRPTVLLDSSGTPAPAPRANDFGSASDEQAAQRGSRSTALLRQVTTESETQREGLVLTDTAPLLISAETEYLARFVDCAIVVAESGVTTRAQLLAAVTTLQRLDVAAMGFVLNRVKLSKADPAFRHSVQEIERHHRAQGMSPSRRAERNSQVAEGQLPEAKELPSESSVGADRAPAVAEHASGPASRRSSPAVPRWQEDAPLKPGLARPEQSVSVGTSDTPWWLFDGDSNPPNVVPEPARPQEPVERPVLNSELRRTVLPQQSWETGSYGPGDFKIERTASAAPAVEAVPVAAAPVLFFSEKAAPVAVSEAAPQPAADPDQGRKPHASESRLKGLRGSLFSIGLKNLGKTQHATLPEGGPALPTESESERTVAADSITPLTEPAATVKSDPIEPVTEEPVAVVAAQVETNRASDSLSEVTALPEFLPPKEFVPINESEGTEAASMSRNNRREMFDEVQTLPSRRGQYKARN